MLVILKYCTKLSASVNLTDNQRLISHDSWLIIDTITSARITSFMISPTYTRIPSCLHIHAKPNLCIDSLVEELLSNHTYLADHRDKI